MDTPTLRRAVRVCILQAQLMVGITFGVVQTLHAQSLFWLGAPEVGQGASLAYDVSADGRVVVGEAPTPGTFYPFVWTPTTGLQLLPILGGSLCKAMAVSADGQVVVGWTSDALQRPRAALWINGVL
ncbi:MAG: hypothetical protein NZM10_05475, partial [Fimbriimonadales bacterium]|nr:hypothetical protein [Fimbriimonadales bacterium]